MPHTLSSNLHLLCQPQLHSCTHTRLTNLHPPCLGRNYPQEQPRLSQPAKETTTTCAAAATAQETCPQVFPRRAVLLHVRRVQLSKARRTHGCGYRRGRRISCNTGGGAAPAVHTLTMSTPEPQLGQRITLEMRFFTAQQRLLPGQRCD